MRTLNLILFFTGAVYNVVVAQIPEEHLSIWLKSTEEVFTDAATCSTPSMGGGDATYCWQDQSINQLTFRRIETGTPTYRLHNQDTLNGFPGIYIDGTNGLVSSISDSLAFTSLTAFVVASNDATGFDGTALDITAPGSWNSFFLASTRIMHQCCGLGSGFYYALDHQLDWTASPYLITTGVFGVGRSDLSLYINGLESSKSPFDQCCPVGYSSTPRSAYIGQRENTRVREGEIIEVIAYGGVKLGDAHRIVVENYLSSKYDLPIVPEGDFYHYDTDDKGHYDFMVTGIGAKNQDTVYSSESSELIISASNEALNDGEFLFIGQLELNDTNTVVNDDLPVGVGERFSRVWALEKTGNVDAGFTFDYALGELEGSPSDGGQYSLLYSATQAPYSFSILSTDATVQGSQVQFDLTNEEIQDGYYTLGAETSIVVGSTNLPTSSTADIFIAPNPAAGSFILRSPKASIESIVLFDLSGRSLPAEVRYNRYEAQVRSDYRGLVIVKVQTDQGIQLRRVVLE
ncbi:MAG: T9SS type A sorting domain-containing protein [Bacteroidetes bacterium]|jgi:hypothetical protein|nr:T9SS type A sorting domain-containing protein [Bacteroidota bacterium]